MFKHSNPSQLLSRVREQSLQAIKDLTLLANNLEEEQLQEIFTKENLQSLFYAIFYPKSRKSILKMPKSERDRIFELGYMFIDSSIDIVGHSLNNYYAERLYGLHKKNFMDILNVIYSDKTAHKL